jgi:hypothetical protein
MLYVQSVLFLFKAVFFPFRFWCGFHKYAMRLDDNRIWSCKNTILGTFAGGPAFVGLGLTLLVPLLFLAPLFPPPPLPPPRLLLPRPPRPAGCVWRLVLVEL